MGEFLMVMAAVVVVPCLFVGGLLATILGVVKLFGGLKK